MDAISRVGELDRGKILRTFASSKELQEYQLHRGDLLFNTRNSHDLVGKSTIFQSDEPNVLYNNNILRMRFQDEVVPEYVATALRRPRLKGEIESRKSGTTSVSAIYWRELKTLPIPIPPLSLQRAFATRVAEAGRLKVKQRAHLTRLDALFAALQRRAFYEEL